VAIKASYTVHPDNERDADSTDRIEISVAATGYYLEAFGGAYQNETGGESIGFELTRANVEELAEVCRRLLDSAHTSEPTT
jgi:hypothetical protein